MELDYTFKFLYSRGWMPCLGGAASQSRSRCGCGPSDKAHLTGGRDLIPNSTAVEVGVRMVGLSFSRSFHGQLSHWVLFKTELDLELSPVFKIIAVVHW